MGKIDNEPTTGTVGGFFKYIVLHWKKSYAKTKQLNLKSLIAHPQITYLSLSHTQRKVSQII